MWNLEIIGSGKSQETYEGVGIQQRIFEVDGQSRMPGFTAVTKDEKLIEYIADPTVSFEDDMVCIEGLWIHHKGGSAGFRAGVIDGNNKFLPPHKLRGKHDNPRLRRQWNLTVSTTESGLAVASPALAVES